MEVHKDIDRLPSFRNAVITIGTFDGVHLGHMQILNKLKEEAAEIGGETVIVTFHPHPRRVISSTPQSLRLINTLEERLELLDQAGIQHVVVTPFTEAFAQQSPDEYLQHFLIGRFHPHTLCIGYDHRFGKDRKGDYLLLEKMAPVYGYQLKEIPKHVLDEISISSTRIRESLLEGKIETADKLLGYPFFFSGIVVDGDKLGRTLGYPTANIEITDEEKIVPGNGIYAVYLETKNKSRLKGMMSIGIRPTVGGTRRVIEVNIFDFDESIYGETLKVFVIKYMRQELKFDSLEKLTEQIGRDKIESLRWL